MRGRRRARYVTQLMNHLGGWVWASPFGLRWARCGVHANKPLAFDGKARRQFPLALAPAGPILDCMFAVARPGLRGSVCGWNDVTWWGTDSSHHFGGPNKMVGIFAV